MDRFITGLEPGKDGLHALVERALAFKRRDPLLPEFPLRGRTVAALFLNPSLRTRASLETAVFQLGGSFIPLSPGSGLWSLEFTEGAIMDGGEEEHIKDAISTLSCYASLVAVRAYPDLLDYQRDRQDQAIRAVSQHATVPVINLESALYHPCQGLADLMTWRELLGDLPGRKLTLCWTWHPRALPMAVPNSVVLMSTLFGMEVTVANPPGYDLDPDVLLQASQQAAEAGGSLTLTNDRSQALEGAQVVYARSWRGLPWYGKGPEEHRHKARLSHWVLDDLAMGTTEDAWLMHALPVRRNVEVWDSVLDGPRSAMIQQAENRLHTQKALLTHLLPPL